MISVPLDPTYEGYCRQLHQVADRIQILTLLGAVKGTVATVRKSQHAEPPKPSQARADPMD